MKRRLSSFALGLLLLGAFALAAEPATPAATSVVAAETTLDGNQLTTELARQLTEHFQLRGELKLTLIRNWIAPTPVAGGYQVTFVDFPARLSSTILARVRIENGGRSFGDLTLTLQAQHFRDVYVVRAPVQRETAFEPAALDVRSVDVLKERDVVAVEDCEGDFTYTTGVQAGRFLAWRDLAKRALVRKGQIIEVAAIDGTMTITTKALAMENGAVGDAIKVRNMTSKKDFTAYVTAEARAQVHF